MESGASEILRKPIEKGSNALYEIEISNSVFPSLKHAIWINFSTSAPSKWLLVI